MPLFGAKTMKKFCQVLPSLAIGTVFFFVLIWLGFIVTLVVTRKSPYEIVWIVGGFYWPFLFGGLVLSRVKGFLFPQLLVPVSAFLALMTFQCLCLHARHWDRTYLFDSMFYLPFLAVPLASFGSLAAKLFFERPGHDLQ